MSEAGTSDADDDLPAFAPAPPPTQVTATDDRHVRAIQRADHAAPARHDGHRRELRAARCRLRDRRHSGLAGHPGDRGASWRRGKRGAPAPWCWRRCWSRKASSAATCSRGIRRICANYETAKADSPDRWPNCAIRLAGSPVARDPDRRRSRGSAAEKFAELDQTITLGKAGRFDDAVAIVRSGAGKSLMDELRRTIDELTADGERRSRRGPPRPRPG